MRKPSDEELRQWGASLREIDPAALQTDPEDGQVRWFLGDAGTELFIWVRPGQSPHHVQLIFAQVSVEWSQGTGLATGSFDNLPGTAGGRYDPYLLSLAPRPDSEVCGFALALLASSPVDTALIQGLVGALQATALVGRRD